MGDVERANDEICKKHLDSDCDACDIDDDDLWVQHPRDLPLLKRIRYLAKNGVDPYP